jgi:hypothetical protein
MMMGQEARHLSHPLGAAAYVDDPTDYHHLVAVRHELTGVARAA